ncbi:MAG: GAF domain-containing protein [candidate division Zixibacteria bacterium]|nr:GAF domain-containing protein [candidate division Zixibacteria bacterium]
MQLISLDHLMLIFLLAGLVMLSRTRKWIVAKNPRGYAQISAGISLISFWGVISVLQNTFFVGEIVSKETAAITEILMLMVVLSGIVLLSSGISYWLPVSRKQMSKTNFAQKNDSSLLALTKLLLAGSATEKLFTEIANWLLNRFELEQVDVISISHKTSHSSLVASAGSLDNLQLLPEANLDKSAWPKELQLKQVTRIDELYSSDSGDQKDFGYALKLPVTENRSLLFVMWSQNSKLAEMITPEIIDILESGIVTNLDQQTLILTSDFTRNCDKKAKRILNMVSKLTNTNEIISLTCKQMAELMPLELITLVSFNNSTESCRLTVGATATVLCETGVNIFESTQTYLTRIFRTAIPVMESDLTAKPLGYGTRMMAASDIKSMIAIPVYAQGRMQGIATVGSTRKKAYTRRNFQMLISAAPVFEFILNMINGDQITQLVLKREKAICRFALDMTDKKRVVADPFRDAARLLYEYSNCDFVRISMLDSGDSFLTSRVLSGSNSQETVVPEKGHMILSLMPNHRSVIETGESLNCGFDNRLNEAELSQCFANESQSALLIPIKSNGRVVGVISLAGFQSEATARFDELTMQFAEMVSALLAKYMEQSLSVSSELNLGEIDNVATQGRLRQGSSLSGESFNTEKTDRLLTRAVKPAGKIALVLTDVNVG